MGDRRKCQTFTASPAEPGGLPVMLAADLNSSCSPTVARHDAIRNEVTIAAPFRVVAAETGGVAGPTPETTTAPAG